MDKENEIIELIKKAQSKWLEGEIEQLFVSEIIDNPYY